MIEYLSAVGLKEYVDEEKLQNLISKIVTSPTNKYITNFKDDQHIKVEYEKRYNDKMGLIVRGNLTDTEELVINFFMPYALSEETIDIVEADVEQRDQDFLYHVYCEDIETGTQMDFSLQNVMDFLDVEEEKGVYIEGTQLMGLSIDGKIILNVDKDEIETEMEIEEDEWRRELLKKARQGDEEAQELLEIEAEEIEDIIEERLQEEDLFSILEGFYMPIGSQDAMYSVLGTIKKVNEWENSLTGEIVYNMVIDSIGIVFEVCINKEDLVGEPMEGMRFLGTCWIQGKLLFS
ncbi:DUF3881 family protein [Vallitalea okinawensis]|uniref:DUF3881 family protein n=1 Tax=Vallitalea okinawensis TaxID=2078660 RepID=UPI000CFDFE73|nr:DUF3881 family protein [Vallitalea okinawensis]